ncbi:hypothetical protein ACIPYQ_41055 [Streptomyces sp. NPDC090045]|uniref:hypothetical protein n=1 Tax=Streptomyces sp. NPDC090045 TaxID=3365927 RepID=UPI003811BB8A
MAESDVDADAFIRLEWICAACAADVDVPVQVVLTCNQADDVRPMVPTPATCPECHTEGPHQPPLLVLDLAGVKAILVERTSQPIASAVTRPCHLLPRLPHVDARVREHDPIVHLSREEAERLVNDGTGSVRFAELRGAANRIQRVRAALETATSASSQVALAEVVATYPELRTREPLAEWQAHGEVD